MGDRRSFLKMLCVAPVAAPFIAAGTKATEEKANYGFVGEKPSETIMQFNRGDMAYLRKEIKRGQEVVIAYTRPQLYQVV